MRRSGCKPSNPWVELQFEVMLARGQVNSLSCLVWTVDLTGVTTPSPVGSLVLGLAGLPCFLGSDGLGDVLLHGERDHLYRSSMARVDHRVYYTRIISNRSRVARAVFTTQCSNSGRRGRFRRSCWQ